MPSAARIKQLEKIIADADRKEAIDLKAMSEYRQANLMEFFNKPKGPPDYGMPANPLQTELLDAWQNPLYKVFGYLGSNRLGKTTILSIITFSVMFGRWLWNDQRLPFPHNHPRKCRILGQGWEAHVKAVLIPELRKWWPQERKLKVKKNQNGVEYIWEDVKTGSVLEIMSNQQDSDMMEGWYGDFVGYDEPPKRENRVALSRGLIDRHGRELFTMTLLKEAWISTEVVNAVTPDGRPDKTVFTVTGDISVNIGYGITQEGVDQFAKTLTDDEKSARLHGKPSYLSGLVLPEFNRQIHMVDRFDVPSNWIVDIALDIHPRERQAGLFIATDERNERYGIEEIWEHGDGDAIADEILKRISKNNYRIGTILIDPLSKSTGEAQEVDDNSTFKKIQRRLWRHDYPLIVASKDRTSGILEIRDHLIGPNKKPSIWFFNDLVRVLFEFEGWMYKDGKAEDKDDHMIENLYRLLLLDTKYVDPEDEWDEEDGEERVGNRVTGY